MRGPEVFFPRDMATLADMPSTFALKPPPAETSDPVDVAAAAHSYFQLAL